MTQQFTSVFVNLWLMFPWT